MTLEVLTIILTHSALKCCVITWRRYNLWWKIWVVYFFHTCILSKHCICGYYGQVYVGRYFSSVTASLHVKVLRWIAWREKTGHWLAFPLYNPHFFLEILDQECELFNFLEIKCQFHTENLTCTLQLFPSIWGGGPLVIQRNPLQDMKLWCRRIPALSFHLSF